MSAKAQPYTVLRSMVHGQQLHHVDDKRHSIKDDIQKDWGGSLLEEADTEGLVVQVISGCLGLEGIQQSIESCRHHCCPVQCLLHTQSFLMYDMFIYLSKHSR